MARIRTIKPEFWVSETIASLSLQARLLFIATWNLADDEGLLRWSSAYVKASAFIYDPVSIAQVTKFMAELEEQRLIFPYKGGKTQQQLACVINFRKHQRINRPQPSKLPPPSIQNREVARMYAERDGWLCGICGEPISEEHSQDERFNLSLDHIKPRIKGGTNYPSNIAATHCSCNKGKRDSWSDSPLDSLDEAVNDSLNDSPPEGEREGEQGRDVEPPLTPAREQRGIENASPRTEGKNPRALGTNPRAVATREAEERRRRQAGCQTCDGMGVVPTDDDGAIPCPDCREVKAS